MENTAQPQSIWTKPIGGKGKTPSTFSGLSFIIGLPVFMLLTIITRTSGIVMLSIICTMGITLIVYVPLICGIGAVTRRLYNKIFHPRDKGLGEHNESAELFTADQKTKSVMTNNDMAIQGYILQARAANTADAQITEKLVTAGWAQAQIDEAFKRCDS